MTVIRTTDGMACTIVAILVAVKRIELQPCAGRRVLYDIRGLGGGRLGGGRPVVAMVARGQRWRTHVVAGRNSNTTTISTTRTTRLLVAGGRNDVGHDGKGATL